MIHSDTYVVAGGFYLYPDSAAWVNHSVCESICVICVICEKSGIHFFEPSITRTNPQITQMTQIMGTE